MLKRVGPGRKLRIKKKNIMNVIINISIFIKKNMSVAHFIYLALGTQKQCFVGTANRRACALRAHKL